MDDDSPVIADLRAPSSEEDGAHVFSERRCAPYLVQDDREEGREECREEARRDVREDAAGGGAVTHFVSMLVVGKEGYWCGATARITAPTAYYYYSKSRSARQMIVFQKTAFGVILSVGVVGVYFFTPSFLCL